MKIFQIILVCIFLTACDGHVRSIYLVEPGMKHPSWSVGQTVFDVEPGFDVFSILKNIEGKYNLEKGKESDIWWTKDTREFSMRLIRDDDGMWRIVLID